MKSALKTRYLLLFLVMFAAGQARLAAVARAQGAREDSSPEVTIQNALLSAGRNALQQNDLSGAAFYYRRYLQQRPDDRSVALEFAGVLTQADLFEEALAVCEKVLSIDPANPEAQKLKAVSLGKLGRTSEALRVIEDLRLRFPDNLELQKTEAGLRAMEGDRDFSRELYSDLLRSGLNNVQDWQDYLQLLAADRQWEMLLKTYSDHLDRFQPTDQVRFSVIQALLGTGELRKVEELYPNLQSESIRRDSALMIADQLAAAGRLDDAVRFLEPVLDDSAPDPNLTAKIALLEAYRKRPLRAMAWVDAVPREYFNERLKIASAKILWASGRPGDALSALDALRLPDSEVEASLARAGLLYDLGREWEVPPLLARIAGELRRAEGPDRRLALCLKALAYIRFGDWNAARETIERFRKEEPADLAPDILDVMLERAARRTLAYEDAVVRLGTRLRDYRPGAELIRPALIEEIPSAAWLTAGSARPSNPFPLIEGAKAAMREGRIQKAFDLFNSAASVPVLKTEALLGMAQCAWRMGAAQQLRKTADLLQDTEMGFAQLVTAARVMLKAGMDGMAESFIARISTDEASHPDTRALRAAWLIRSGRSSEARKLLGEIEPSGPLQIGLITYQCVRMAELGKDSSDPVYTMARDRLLFLASLDFGHGVIDAALAATDMLMLFNEQDKAFELLKRLEREYPRDLRVNERLMTVYIRMGRYNPAETQARKILKRRPGDAMRRNILARIPVWRSDYPLAWRRYGELIADYPDDRLFPLEFEAKRSRALGRTRKAQQLYDEYAELVPTDREIVVESGDVFLSDNFSKAAASRYEPASWAFPNDEALDQALETANRQSRWGVYGKAAYDARQGEDRQVDVRQTRFEGGVRFPRGPDATTFKIGLGNARFQFDDERSEPLNARLLNAGGRWVFTNGLDIAAGAEFLDYNKGVDSNWRADVDVGYRGMDAWKIAGIAGRHDIRDNYYTIIDGLQSSWIGAYGQWQPLERLELFAQYRFFEIDAPQPGALLPPDLFNTNVVTPVVTTNIATGAVSTNIPNSETWERNYAHEGVAEASYRLLFFPHSLRLWVNGYFYDTAKDNQMYWTPEGTFFSCQTGLHWRHALGRRHFPGAPLFYYGLYAAMGVNTDGDNSPMLKGEIGLQNWKGWSLGADAGRVWGDKYEETSAGARLEYLF